MVLLLDVFWAQALYASPGCCTSGDFNESPFMCNLLCGWSSPPCFWDPNCVGVVAPPTGFFIQALPTPDKTSQTLDPVNIATGEDYFSATDFSLSGRGPKLTLFREYRSFSAFTGMFGYGWRTDFDINLNVDPAGDVIIYNGEGTGIFFMNYAGTYAGTYAASPGNYTAITKNADNTFTLTDKSGLVTHYDINGRLSSRTDRNGNTLTFVYNPAQVGGTYIQDASGRRIKLYFNSNGSVSSAVDPAGKTFQYGYDVHGNLVSVMDPSGAVTNYAYDANHKIIQFTNANGHNTYYQYDAQGRVTMNWRDNNVNKVTLTYQTDTSDTNTKTVVTDSLGNNNTYVFNKYGLMLSRTDPQGAVTQQTWDFNLNRTSLTDARNNVTSFSYDWEGNLVQITDPLGHQTNMTYTTNFNLISSKTDALGNVTNFSYDNNGNLTNMADALGNNHSFVHDQYGHVITATDSRGNATYFTYDALGHVIQKTDALGDKSVFTYQ